MKKKLTPIGNSLGLVLDKPLLELLGIDRETELELLTDGECLVIQPVRSGGRRKQVSRAIDSVLTRHASTMRKLAR
ncbi:AbrB/MazE/SpoVT family DNA-binding domain-containing protein [Aggregicoccus sp. 17bor-14]|nr:AbrB/MazE/SpoVT family DNA-binding domain-containing protein [Simulacricoccus sp. 17bor-14]MRI91772.1 AbrB/MazE/SpoVT family DNA-binding domain-containing protein [Aggregicoccus sp. 17bor-14]